MKLEGFSIKDLALIIDQRKSVADNELSHNNESYTTMLLKKGKAYIWRKILEEMGEVIIESHHANKEKLIEELSDLFYHVLVLATAHDISFNDIEKCLAMKHKKLTISEKSGKEKEIEKKLKKYIDKTWPFNAQNLIEFCKFSDAEVGDVLLFSHNFRQTDLSKVVVKNIFSSDAKSLRTFLQSKGIKVKMCISEDEQEVFKRYRDSDLILPIILVLNAVALPVLINLLSAYIKDWLDKYLDKPDNSDSNFKITIGIVESADHEENWYSIQGSYNEVYQCLCKLIKKNKTLK